MTLVWKSGLNLQSPASNDPLLDLNTQPSLDLQFATGKTLNDRVSGLPLVNHQRDASSGKSAGTYVGSDGLIKTSPVNLLTYSEDFSPSWFAGTATVSAAPSVLSPTGTANTKELSVGTRYAPLYVVTAGNQYTFSIYVRSAGLSTQFALTSQGGFTGDRSTLFNIIDGTLVSSGSGVDNYSITSFPDGWYRVSQTDTAETSTNTTWEIESVNSSAYIWGAQLEEGPTVNTYVPTTNFPSGAPRFDYGPVTGESLGLLIEEERTNELTFSSTLDAYGASSIASKTQNAGIAPDGTNTAVLAETISTGTDSHLRRYTSQVVNTTYTYSFFAKPGTVDYAIVYNIAKNSVGLTWFNVANGTIGTTASGVTPFIKPAGNGWYRVGVTLTTDSTITNNIVDIRWALVDGVTTPTTGENVYVWGAQLEVGSFPTSYIPTTSSTVTRARDNASIEGTNFSSLYNQSEGTVFVAVDKANQANTVAASLDDGTGDNKIELRSSGSVVTSSRFDINENSIVSYSQQAPNAGAVILRLALAYKAGSVNSAVNGVVNTVNVSASIPNVSRLVFHNSTFLTDRRPGHISRLTYYPYRLADATLQEITS